MARCVKRAKGSICCLKMYGSEPLLVQRNYDPAVCRSFCWLITDNNLHLATRVNLKHSVIAWNASMAHRYGLQPVQVNDSSIIQQCQSFDLPNNDTVKASNFVLYTPGTPSSWWSIREVLEMLHLTSGAGCVYVLIQSYEVADFAVPYWYPLICPKTPEMIELIEARVSHWINVTYYAKCLNDCVLHCSVSRQLSTPFTIVRNINVLLGLQKYWNKSAHQDCSRKTGLSTPFQMMSSSILVSFAQQPFWVPIVQTTHSVSSPQERVRSLDTSRRIRDRIPAESARQCKYKCAIG